MGAGAVGQPNAEDAVRAVLKLRTLNSLNVISGHPASRAMLLELGWPMEPVKKLASKRKESWPHSPAKGGHSHRFQGCFVSLCLLCSSFDFSQLPQPSPLETVLLAHRVQL